MPDARGRLRGPDDALDASRRDVLRGLAAACMLGALAGCRSAPLAGRTPPATPAPDDGGYLARGLMSLATISPKGWVPGHAGAAVIAGHFFCVDHGLDARAVKAVRANLDGCIARTPQDYPEPDPGPGRADPERIVERLAPRMHELRAGGHDKIYAALALRALRARPDFATPAIVDGICRLLDALYASRRAEAPSDWARAHPLAPCESPSELAAETLRATLRPWSHVREVGASGVLHWVTHAEALVALEDLGYGDLARRGYAAHRQHVHRPVAERPDEPPRRPPFDWRAAAYWESDRPRRLFQGSWLGGHAFKLPHSLFRLLALVEDPALGVAGLERAAQLQIPFE
jgi:hypothetical protein